MQQQPAAGSRKALLRVFGLASLLAALGALTLGAASAGAHQVCTVHAGGDYACLLDDDNNGIHGTLVGCDTDRDGNYAYIRWYYYGVLQPARMDPDGAGGNCTFVTRSEYVGGLDSFNICVQNEGCARPVYSWQF